VYVNFCVRISTDSFCHLCTWNRQQTGRNNAELCWGWASECPDVKNYKWWLNPVWHRMLYSCTHMATVGVKGL